MSEFLGEGSYGCTISPAVPCDSNIKQIAKGKRGTRLVSKVISDADTYKRELIAARQAALIDPVGKSILVPVKGCSVSRKAVETNSKSMMCDTIRESSATTLYQLVMPYGGRRFDKEIRDMGSVPLHKLLVMLEPLFDGLLMLDKKKQCHQDIKGGNVLLTPQGKAIIIDYGLMVPYSTVYTNSNYRRLKYSYYPYPPEYKVFRNLVDADGHDLSDVASIDDIIKDAFENITSFGDNRQTAYSKYITGTKFKTAVKHMVRLFSAQSNKAEWASLYTDRIDVYGVGMLIASVGNHVQPPKSAKLRDQFHSFVRHLVYPDMTQRATPAEAHDEFTKLLRASR